ncbi:acyl carrier protein [Anaeromusa sp.]|uniref:acyl carrier protein n=1 Tax=Anaeromusa sp. TaxID=1872520 RepID=UPI002602D8AA|nr:acyl carrier protein [Anaeromusa sp.]MDD3158334.1 acyl carrier protein [Anaeromusa sp.]
MERFLELVQDVLDTEQELSLEDKIYELEDWDSLTVVALLARIYNTYGKSLTVQELQNVQTLGDLFALLPEAQP